MRGMLASGLVLPSKRAGWGVRANRMHRQGLDRRPQNNFAFLTLEFGSPKKWFSIAHENRQNENVCSLRGSFDIQNGSDSPWGKLDALTSSWRTSTKKIWHFWLRNPDHPKMVCYSTRKLSKWGVFSLRGSFDLKNESDGPWGKNVCINKVLTAVQKNWHFCCRNSDHPKNGLL